MTQPDVQVVRDALLSAAARHGMRRVRVFGSAARGDGGEGSDLDLLVDVAPGRSLLDVIAFTQEAEDILRCKVDVVTDGGMSPYLRDRIYADAVPL
ncbi:MAG: nucleotidyltransferase family protein [Gemmatimonadales bacterium]